MKRQTLLGLTLALALAMPMAACSVAPVPEETGGTEVTTTEREQPDAPQEQEAEGDAAATDAAEQAAPVEASAEDVSVTWDDSRLFTGTSLGNYETLTTYAVEGYDDVPFVRASEYLPKAISDTIRTSFEDGVLTVSVNDTEATIDTGKDTVHFDNSDRFYSKGVIDGAILDPTSRNVVTPSVKHASTQTEPTPVTIRLADYHLPVIAYEDDALMPFLALQNTFGAITGQNDFSYNGKDYFNSSEIMGYMLENETTDVTKSPYSKAAYSGPFSEKSKLTQAYADYGYYSTCLLLDLCYGHKEEKDIDTFDHYFERIDVKDSLLSLDPQTVGLAEMLVFYYLFDSGHDASMPMWSVFKGGLTDMSRSEEIIDDMRKSEEGGELFGEETDLDEESKRLVDAVTGAFIEKGLNIPEIVPTLAWMTYMGQAKPEDYGDQRLDFADDTAVIYFESFKDDTTRDPSFYLDPITEEDEDTSNFAFFHNCFKAIEEHGGIKNVVINICNNGGGDSTGLISILGFLSEDGEVNLTDLHLLSGSYREERYHVDTNLDGIADDNDGYGGDYDFYILTSGQSYSCGTALPYFAQRDGLAKIIGANPGGGDCCVWKFNDALGLTGSFSGMFKLGTKDASGFVSDEKACTVDFDMMPTVLDITNVPWFDPAGIAEAVHRFKAGDTRMDYGSNSGLEQLPTLLQNLFEQLGEAA